MSILSSQRTDDLRVQYIVGWKRGWRGREAESDEPKVLLGWKRGRARREEAIASGAWYPGCGRPKPRNGDAAPGS